MRRRAPFYVFLAILIVLSIAMLRSVIIPTLLAVILAYVLLPVYDWMGQRVHSPTLRSVLLIVLVLFVIALPLIFIVTQAIKELPRATEALNGEELQALNARLDAKVGRHIAIAEN